MLRRLLRQFMTDTQVERCYINAGNTFGDVVSYLYMGECVGFEKMLARWEEWEAEYAKRGYRTIPLDVFIESGGHGAPLRGIGAKREAGEEPVLHAKNYREHHLRQFEPVVDPQETSVRIGIYTCPPAQSADE